MPRAPPDRRGGRARRRERRACELSTSGPSPCSVESPKAAGTDTRPRREPAHAGRGRSPTRASPASAASSPARPLVDGGAGAAAPAADRRLARIEPERVSEKLHQMTFWQGRGGADHPRDQRHRHRALGHPRQGHRAADRPPARAAATATAIKPYGSLLFDEPATLRDTLQARPGAGLPGDQARLGAVRPASTARTDEAIVAAAREAVGPDVELMVDAGGCDAFWPHGYKWALRDGADAGRLRRRLVRGGAAARTTSRASCS